MTRLVAEVVPSLSRSLAEQFNVFRVMHHGTHEKQLSNVFAWLLDTAGTHELGDAFQAIFIERLNEQLPADSQMPFDNYLVTQEVDTSAEGEGKDIADIVLTSRTASIVVENYGSSDGHGHNYHGYLSHGESDGRQTVVALLCIRHLPHLQIDGWENAVVLTYADLLSQLQDHITQNRAWRDGHRQQQFFINQLVENFVEGPRVVNNEDRISFIKTMCETGESERYGAARQEAAAQEFAEQVAQHAQHQYEEGRNTLRRVKRELRTYMEHRLKTQLNNLPTPIPVDKVNSRFMGKYSWLIAFGSSTDPDLKIQLLFGPTAAAYLAASYEQPANPDYSRIFVKRGSSDIGGGDKVVQTEVGLEEVLSGLGYDDVRLRDALVKLVTE